MAAILGGRGQSGARHNSLDCQPPFGGRVGRTADGRVAAPSFAGQGRRWPSNASPRVVLNTVAKKLSLVRPLGPRHPAVKHRWRCSLPGLRLRSSPGPPRLVRSPFISAPHDVLDTRKSRICSSFGRRQPCLFRAFTLIMTDEQTFDRESSPARRSSPSRRCLGPVVRAVLRAGTRALNVSRDRKRRSVLIVKVDVSISNGISTRLRRAVDPTVRAPQRAARSIIHRCIAGRQRRNGRANSNLRRRELPRQRRPEARCRGCCSRSKVREALETRSKDDGSTARWHAWLTESQCRQPGNHTKLEAAAFSSQRPRDIKAERDLRAAAAEAGGVGECSAARASDTA